MSRKIAFFSEQAKLNYQSLSCYYVDSRLSFQHELEKALRQIEMFPESAPMIEQTEAIRRMRIRGFPCSFLYVVYERDILVLKIIQDHQRLPEKDAS